MNGFTTWHSSHFALEALLVQQPQEQRQLSVHCWHLAEVLWCWFLNLHPQHTHEDTEDTLSHGAAMVKGVENVENRKTARKVCKCCCFGLSGCIAGSWEPNLTVR